MKEIKGKTALGVLEILKKERHCSGESMAAKLGVSRASVWKAVRALRGAGYEIDGGSGRGYALKECRAPRASGVLAAAGEAKAPLFLFKSVPSTNDVALELLKEKCPHLTAVVANAQSEGRGRVGRKFFSPAGTGIYMSVVVRSVKSYEELLVVTPAAAVAVRRAIADVFGLDTRIKWVNDLYFCGKKVCGILTQSAVDEKGALLGAVVGIGINVTGQMPPELKDKARSLKESVSERERDALIGATISRLSQVCAQLGERTFMDEYREFSYVIGKKVSFERGGAEYSGVAESIDDDGALYVRAGAELIKINSGEISLSSVI